MEKSIREWEVIGMDSWAKKFQLLEMGEHYGDFQFKKENRKKILHLYSTEGEWFLEPDNMLQTRYKIMGVSDPGHLGLFYRHKHKGHPMIIMDDKKKYTWHSPILKRTKVWRDDSGNALVSFRIKHSFSFKKIGTVRLAPIARQDANYPLLIMLGAYYLKELYYSGG